MSDRARTTRPVQQDNYQYDGETGNESVSSGRNDNYQYGGDTRTDRGGRNGGGCCCGGCACCQARNDAYEDPTRARRHNAARERMDREGSAVRTYYDDAGDCNRRGPTQVDRCGDPNYYLRRSQERQGLGYLAGEEYDIARRRTEQLRRYETPPNTDEYSVNPRAYEQRYGQWTPGGGHRINHRHSEPNVDFRVGNGQFGVHVGIGDRDRYDQYGRPYYGSDSDYGRYRRDEYGYRQPRYDQDRYDYYGNRRYDDYYRRQPWDERYPTYGDYRYPNGNSTQDWYRRHPNRYPWDERSPMDDYYYGNRRYPYDYGNRYPYDYGRNQRDGVYFGIGPNGQFQVGVQKDGFRIGVGSGNDRYGTGRYGRDYDYYDSYQDPYRNYRTLPGYRNGNIGNHAHYGYDQYGRQNYDYTYGSRSGIGNHSHYDEYSRNGNGRPQVGVRIGIGNGNYGGYDYGNRRGIGNHSHYDEYDRNRQQFRLGVNIGGIRF